MAPRRPSRPDAPPGAPDWYRDAIIYEVHIRAFSDSVGDGFGDLRGLTDRLDYLHDLGVTAIWVLPFYPSPLRDDGYDISDYTSINPRYGDMRDFRRFVREAHKRGLRVITELVLNHTSDQHPWFQRARRAPAGSRWRNFYVWSDTPERYEDARIIFQDFETSNWSWDAVAGAYYWHRFYAHQPDLNFESADVRRAVTRVLDFWLGLGVDGLRLDAVPYLYEREGTICENLEETHAFLRGLRRHVDEEFPGRMLLAEANQWPEDAAEYFGDGDECHMAFHFPLMPRLFMAIQQEDRFPIIDILQQTPDLPEGAQWALFLRNHDELTLEMVTDEERDYMYRAYAIDSEARINLGIRRRLAPLLGNNRRKIELMNGLLLSLPGTPVVYYGDELGMGDNIYLGDRDGVRTPMQWSGDRNAGFSRANPQKLYLPPIIDPQFHYETINVEAQLDNPHSLLWHIRRLLWLRRRSPVFGRGELEFLHPENRRVLAYVRSLGDERVLVVANLSRFSQFVELELSDHKGMTPVEMMGQTPFPPIGDLPYLLTLGPHEIHWFALRPAPPDLVGDLDSQAPPVIRVPGGLASGLAGRAVTAVERALAGYVPRRRWFAGKARKVRSLAVKDVVPLKARDDLDAALVIIEIEYGEGEPETYAVPLVVVEGERAERVEADVPVAVVARVERDGPPALLCDAMIDPAALEAVLDAIRRRRRLRGRGGELVGRPARGLRGVFPPHEPLPEPSVFRAEQSNSSVGFGGAAIMKLFRRIESGIHPDVEMGTFLSASRAFENSPPVLGSLEYRPGGGGEPSTVAIVHELVQNEGDAWQYTIDTIGLFYERILTEWASRPPEDEESGPAAEEPTSRLEAARSEPDPEARELAGYYLDSVELLGRRVAEMHGALAASDDPAFAPESVTPLYQRSVYQSMRNLAVRNLRLLRRTLDRLPERERAWAERTLEREDVVMEALREVMSRSPEAFRIRCHGDLHLGQVLFTGKDFVIIDFEGEPSRSIGDRRVKRSALRDVAGMLRSFDYAQAIAREEQVRRGAVEAGGEAHEALARWGRRWRGWVESAFLRGYLAAAAPGIVPPDDQDLESLLRAFVMEKATYELGYELNSRPDLVGIPLRGILREVGASR
jgi:maltose alpha-D-glucosyltransferase/alpha-amylase